MKKTAVLVLTLCFLLLFSALAMAEESLTYNAPSSVMLRENGTASFDIKVISRSEKYAAVNVYLALGNGVEIEDIQYKINDSKLSSGILPLQLTEESQASVFGILSDKNDWEGDLICTVNISYSGSDQGEIEVRRVVQGVILERNKTTEYKNDIPHTITLIPYGAVDPDPSYKITCNAANNGSVSANPSTAKEGESVTLTFTPNGNYVVDKWTVTTAGGRDVVVNEISNVQGTIFMPADDVTVTAASASGTPNPGGSGGSGSGSGGNNATTDPGTAITDPTAPLAQRVAGFIQGFEDNTFRPEAMVTREQFVTILYRLKSTQPTAGATPSFNDVAVNRWSYNAVEWARQQGIASANAAGNFRPADVLTRAEMAEMLVKTEKFTEAAENTFTDITDHANQADILKGVKAGIFNGYPDNTFRPDNGSTRAETVKALVCYLLGGEPADALWQNLTVSFTDMTSAHWAYKYVLLSVNGFALPTATATD